MATPSIDYSHLSISERIRLVQEIWDSIAEHPEALELTDAQRAELDRRLAQHRKDPESAIPWEEVRRDLMSR
jgi:putative addiction module component (TIGR02574 family)